MNFLSEQNRLPKGPKIEYNCKQQINFLIYRQSESDLKDNLHIQTRTVKIISICSHFLNVNRPTTIKPNITKTSFKLFDKKSRNK